MKQKVALVLSGGGARGIAHIGVIEELEKQGFEITSIAGTSMGAVVGGVYVLGKMEAYKNWLYSLDKIKLFSLVDFSFSNQGLVKGDKLLNTIKAFIPDAHIEDLHIPYAAVAADIINKKEVVFTQGSIFDAIRASMAFPTVFTPVKTENGLLVDGGLINNLPINHIKRTANDILIAVNVNADIPEEKPVKATDETVATQSNYQIKLKNFYKQLQMLYPGGNEEKPAGEEKARDEEHLGYFNLITRALGLMAFHITEITLKTYSPDILINISQHACGIFDFYKAEEMVETGRQAAIKGIAAYTPAVKTKAGEKRPALKNLLRFIKLFSPARRKKVSDVQIE